jgi:hypothetical protein
MSIRFRCSCGQKLRVGDDKAGQRAKCPRCKSAVTVPAASENSDEPVPPPSSELPSQSPSSELPAKEPHAAPPLSTEDPTAARRDMEKVGPVLPEIVIRDDSEDWAHDSASPPPRTESVIDYDKVAVPRRVLYLQGILLGVVALVSFVLGMLMSDRPPPEQAANAQPCVLSGQVTYGEEQSRPDDGSVIIVLPVDRRPAADARVSIEGLRPGDPLPADSNISMRTIRSLGGDYVRTNEQGQYRLRLPENGRYHVLIISHRSARPSSDQMEMSDVAQIGRYFASVTDLISDRKYQWRTLAIRRDESLDATF